MKISVRKTSTLSIALLAILPIAKASAQHTTPSHPDKPNIVIILADDQGYGGVNCYPHIKKIVTPNIDKLAASGVQCMQGYTSGHLSSPTRAGLMTGKYQQSFGFYGLSTPHVGGIPQDQKLLSEYLVENGYDTACIGKWHLGDYIRSHPNNRGFQTFFGFINGLHDYYDPLVGGSWDGVYNGLAFTLDNMEPVTEMEYSTYEYTKRAVDFIQKNADHPFFLYLPYNAIHSPLQAPEELIGELAINPQEIGKDDIGRAMTFALDQGVGKVVETLEQLGLRDNTIIFYLSDNGAVEYSDKWEFRGRKGSYYEGGIRVPFIVSYPAKLAKGTIYNKPVMSIDIAPTVMELAGLSHTDMHGVNLLPYLSGKDQTAPHDVLYWSTEKKSNNQVFKNEFAIRQGKWKLVSDPHFEKDYDLYDIEADPQEKHGLKDQYPEKYKELFGMYLNWINQMPEELANGENARLKGMELMRKYQRNLKKSGKKVVPLSFGPHEKKKGKQ